MFYLVQLHQFHFRKAMGQLIAGMTGQLVAAMSGVPYPLQNAQTTGNGDTVACPPSFRNHTFIITGTAGVGAGAIQLESSNSPLDANVWGPLTGAPIVIVAATDIIVEVVGLFNFIRARISTNVTGGTVTVQYNGAKSY
jgi:hypothetical protein